MWLTDTDHWKVILSHRNEALRKLLKRHKPDLERNRNANLVEKRICDQVCWHSCTPNKPDVFVLQGEKKEYKAESESWICCGNRAIITQNCSVAKDWRKHGTCSIIAVYGKILSFILRLQELNVLPATPELKSWSSPASTAGVFLPLCPRTALCSPSTCSLWKTLCVPISSYFDYLGAFTSPPVCLSLNLSQAQPCELVTLSVLSIWAYHPRGPERITFLTSPRQMFMTEKDRTSSLHIQPH